MGGGDVPRSERGGGDGHGSEPPGDAHVRTGVVEGGVVRGGEPVGCGAVAGSGPRTRGLDPVHQSGLDGGEPSGDPAELDQRVRGVVAVEAAGIECAEVVDGSVERLHLCGGDGAEHAFDASGSTTSPPSDRGTCAPPVDCRCQTRGEGGSPVTPWRRPTPPPAPGGGALQGRVGGRWVVPSRRGGSGGVPRRPHGLGGVA